MGMFSWLYSDTGRQMTAGFHENSYLLVPPEFQEKYGAYIVEDCYDGYGNMGGRDVYALVAEWNRGYIDTGIMEMEKPKRSQFTKCPWDHYITDEELEARYQRAVSRYRDRVKRLEEFNAGKVSVDREIGIDIACYDNQNEQLKYPIKITSKPMPYDAASPSKSDPFQGCL